MAKERHNIAWQPDNRTNPSIDGQLVLIRIAKPVNYFFESELMISFIISNLCKHTFHIYNWRILKKFFIHFATDIRFTYTEVRIYYYVYSK